MATDGSDDDQLYRTVRRAARDGVREALWDAVTVVIAFLLLALGLPLVLAGAGGRGPAAWVVVAVGLVIVAMAGYRLYARFGR